MAVPSADFATGMLQLCRRLLLPCVLRRGVEQGGAIPMPKPDEVTLINYPRC